MKLLVTSLALLGFVASKALPESEDNNYLGGDFEYAMNNEDCYDDNSDSQAGNIEDDIIIDNLDDNSELDCEDAAIDETDLLDVIIAEPAFPDDDDMTFVNRYDGEEEFNSEYDEECEDDPIDEDDDDNEPDVIPAPTENPDNQHGGDGGDEYIDNADCYSEDYGNTEDSVEPEEGDYNPLDDFDSVLDNADHAYSDLDNMLVNNNDFNGEGESEPFEECIEY